MNFGIAALVFGVIFISELPDKSMFAALMLGTRYRPLYVWLGAASAFLVHVIIAVTIGQAFNLLPHRVVDLVVALLFLAGALLLLLGKHGVEEEPKPKKLSTLAGKPHSLWKIYGAAFGLIFLSEWGDITQIATANYTARYHDPISVGLGAVLALWTVTTLAIVMGSKLIKLIPAQTLQRVTAVILLFFAAVSAFGAIR
jgi:putative Ca2+/H+ antiporter (TMEM165/GDT1 family)